MFKFIKEIKESIKEGLDEGLDEARREAAVEASDSPETSLEDRLKSVGEEEQFAVALCAPYREVYSRCIGSWAGKSAETLYRIELPEEDTSDYAEILERDFDAIDERTTLEAIELFKTELQEGSGYAFVYDYIQQQGMLNNTPKAVMALPNNEYTKKSIDAVLSSHSDIALGSKSGDAFRIAVIAHCASAAGALGYLTHEQTMEHLRFAASLAKTRYSSWQHYSAGFVAGQRAWAFQNPLGEKLLVGAIKKLHVKEQSPWQTLAWE